MSKFTKYYKHRAIMGPFHFHFFCKNFNRSPYYTYNQYTENERHLSIENVEKIPNFAKTGPLWATFVFRFLQNCAQIYASLSRLFDPEILFRGFLCDVHALISSSCIFCTDSQLLARSLSRVMAIFCLQNSARMSVLSFSSSAF